MPKNIDDEYREWWRETGRELGSTYSGPAIVAEAAFKAGADVIIERLTDGKAIEKGDGDDT
ncbi:MAG: hypothetical protein ACYTG0_38650 [Planctomycetota bacterium]|jgi:hypothetical protein